MKQNLLQIPPKRLAQQSQIPEVRRVVFPFRAARSACQVVVCAFLACGSLEATNVIAAPADEIRTAVIAGGAMNLEAATPPQFLRAFTAVLARVKEQKHPDYVTTAIKLRSDLAPQITVAALRAHQPDGKDLTDSCHWADSIIRAAIAAAPTAKEAIVRAAVEAEPYAKECILAAAGMKTGDSIEMAFFRPPGVDAGNINSSALGTINPANLSAQGNEISRFRP